AKDPILGIGGIIKVAAEALGTKITIVSAFQRKEGDDILHVPGKVFGVPEQYALPIFGIVCIVFGVSRSFARFTTGHFLLFIFFLVESLADRLRPVHPPTINASREVCYEDVGDLNDVGRLVIGVVNIGLSHHI